MAALQTIRKHNVLLVGAIGIALALFILSDFSKCTGSKMPDAGEIAGEKIPYDEFQQYLKNYQFFNEQFYKGRQMADEQANETAWRNFVQHRILGEECKQLGLTASDDEVANALLTGTYAGQQIQSAMYLLVRSFFNPETQQLDPVYIEQITKTEPQLKDYYLFVQDEIRQEITAIKYQTLLAKGIISNPIEAKKHFADRTADKDVLLVSVPLSTVKDEDVKVSDEDLKKKYEELKPRFAQQSEMREVKFIDVVLTPSEADREAAKKEMEAEQKNLLAATTKKDITSVVRKSSSKMAYTDLLLKKDLLPSFVQAKLGADSTSIKVGETTDVDFDPESRCFYTVRLLDKKTETDEVLARVLQIVGNDEKTIENRADSTVNALNTGADFKEIAKKFNQPSDSTWFSTQSLAQQGFGIENIPTILAIPDNSAKIIKLQNGVTLVVYVMEKKEPVEKYNVAVIAKELKYSQETSNAEYNKLNAFLGQNGTDIKKLEENAPKSNYFVQTANVGGGVRSINNIAKTGDIVRWAMDEASKGEISQTIYRCGDADAGHYIIAALSDVIEPGFVPFEKVKEQLKPMVMNEKKAEKILADVKGINSIEAAKAVKGAQTDSLTHINFYTFSNPQMPRNTGNEPVVGVLAAKTAKGAFGKAVKGQYGVYMLQVLDEHKSEEKYDEKAELQTTAQENLNYMSFSDLYRKANIQDYRYKFFNQ